jgi:twitching motility two-component system response regulator PilH
MAKVLIVDDSAAYRFRLRRLLHKLGHEAVSAHDGNEALDVARRSHPQLILMDIVMPGINGYEATRALARDEDTQNIPVIFVSSRTEETDRTWGMRQGAAGYVTKPVALEQLQSAIAAAINT